MSSVLFLICARDMPQMVPAIWIFSMPVASMLMPSVVSNIGDTLPTTCTMPLVGG